MNLIIIFFLFITIKQAIATDFDKVKIFDSTDYGIQMFNLNEKYNFIINETKQFSYKDITEQKTTKENIEQELILFEQDYFDLLEAFKNLSSNQQAIITLYKQADIDRAVFNNCTEIILDKIQNNIKDKTVILCLEDLENFKIYLSQYILFSESKLKAFYINLQTNGYTLTPPTKVEEPKEKPNILQRFINFFKRFISW